MSNNNLSISECSAKKVLSESRYIVPMYQRNFAWTDEEINQFLQDAVESLKEKSSVYYIGSLVVDKKRNNTFEVIDGQQRLTCLTLLAICLKDMSKNNADTQKYPDMSWYKKVTLSFESRPISDKHLESLFENGKSYTQISDDTYTNSLIDGYTTITLFLNALKECTVKKLADHIFNCFTIIRITVPPETDLNHYFEVMNNRGDQLEKHEVLKAKLMSMLQRKYASEASNYIAILEEVWTACSNMNRYVQYGFSVENRKRLFGDTWETFTVKNFNDLKKKLNPVSVDSNSPAESITAILKSDPIAHPSRNESLDEVPAHFSSILDFPNFLLHVLRIKTLQDVSLDEKQLLKEFTEHLGLQEAKQVIASKKSALTKSVHSQKEELITVEEFIFDLLKSRFLFDQFILKRDLDDDQLVVEKLKATKNKDGSYSGYPVKSFAKNKRDAHNLLNKKIEMLQAAFHVSTPNLIYKHWLNAALKYLYTQENVEIEGHAYFDYLFNIARQFVFKRYLAKGDGSDFYQIIYPEAFNGQMSNVKANKQTNRQAADKKKQMPKTQAISTEKALQEECENAGIDIHKLQYGHIENVFIFNFLDFLLWQNAQQMQQIVSKQTKTNRTPTEEQKVINKYSFTFRSSVEHFYPQTPENNRNLPDEYLHCFGNLCLISHSKNSSLGNKMPKSKISKLQNDIETNTICSLKLYRMIKMCERQKDTWTSKEIQEHEKEMIITLLAC